MRIILMLVLLAISGSAWADVMKVKAKAGRDSYEHGHNRYDKHEEWDWKRPSWSLFYSKNNRHHGYRNYNGHDRHHNKGHHYNREHYNHRGNWRSADRFRTRRSHKSEPVIYINAEVSAISLRGTKRHAAIYEVYAELGNGRRIPLRDLEGSLHRGDSFTRHFREPRYIKKLFSVEYLPANKNGKNRHH